jgi:hypothetical protein
MKFDADFEPAEKYENISNKFEQKLYRQKTVQKKTPINKFFLNFLGNFYPMIIKQTTQKQKCLLRVPDAGSLQFFKKI